METNSTLVIFAIIAALGLVTVVAVDIILAAARKLELKDVGIVLQSTQVREMFQGNLIQTIMFA